jgi:large subunit ribosomal protein L10
MSKEKKAKVIEGLEEVFAKSNAGILTDYRGLATTEVSNLRRKLRTADAEYKVVKNTLAKIAVKKAGKEYLADALNGPMAIAFGYGSEIELAKALTGYIRTSKSEVSIKGGFLGERLLSASEVEKLATLPGKEVLISQVMAGMQSPIVSFMSVLSAPLKGIMCVLQGRIKQLEET